jgi:parallel beta helix pectate lyase-like protein
MHGRSAGVAVGSGLLVVGGLATAAVTQAKPAGVHVEVFSDSGAAAVNNAATKNFGNGSTKESLADAITYVNSHAGGGTITFASTLSGDTIHLAASLPAISAPTTISGLGARKLAVSGAGLEDVFVTYSQPIRLNGLTVEGSSSVAVFSTKGAVTITDSVIQDSGSDAVYVGEPHDNMPKVTLVGDTITNNRQIGVFVANFGALTIEHSLIEHNDGGVETYGTAGVHNGPTTITGSSIVNNGGVGGGGNGGLAMYSRYLSSGPETIVNSTISGNELLADADRELSGGGILVDAASVHLTLVGDTVVGNKVDNTDTGVGVYAAGGGIAMNLDQFDSSTKLTVEDSVVAGNKVVAAGGASAERYPDIAIAAPGTSLVKDSLIGAGARAADTLTALSFDGGNQKGTTAHPLAPRLGKLGPEGSKTATAGGRLWVQEPLKGSPLIGKGAAKPFSTKLDPFTTDELGTKRPAKGVTIGAYQVPPKKKPKKRK